MNESRDTIVALLLAQAEAQPDAPAFIDPAGRLSYGELARGAGAAAAWLAEQGVKPGDTVALSLFYQPPNALGALELFYGAAWLGAVVLPVFPDVPPERRAQVAQRQNARMVEASQYRHGQRTAPPPRGDQPDRPLLMQFTSGTTGEPKALLFSQAQFAGKTLRAARALGLTRSDRFVSARPWPGLVGMRSVLWIQSVGGTYVNTVFPTLRRDLAALVSRQRLTVMTAGPSQVRPLLRQPGGLVDLRALCIGGAPVSAREVQEVRDSLCRNTYVNYGVNELGLVSLLGPEDAPGEDGRVGRLLPDVQCESVDGELRFRVPWTPEGYYQNPAATAARFRDGWFYPNDLGEVGADGYLVLRGRADEVINSGGVKIMPSAIEAVLLEHPDVADAAVIGLPDAALGEAPVAFIVPRANAGRQAIEDFCKARVDGTRRPAAYRYVESIPRNAAGKVDRAMLRKPPAADAEPATIIGLVLAHARARPDAPALVHAQGKLTYGEVARGAGAGAAWLAAQGVKAGDTIALSFTDASADALPLIDLFYGAAWLGALVLPLFPDVPAERRAAIAARYNARVIEHAKYRQGSEGASAPRGDRPERPFLMQFTSGTTGEPKAMLITQAGLAGKFLRAARAYALGPNDCIASGRPWPALVGMRHMMRAHCVGATFAQTSLSLDRAELARTISSLGITVVITSPAPLRALLQSPGPLLQLRALRIGGAPVSAHEVHEGRARLCANLMVTYGTNETGTLTILRAEDPPEPEGRVGRLLPDVQCEEVGGELRFRVPWMAEGYLGNAAASDARFREGWFYPGDLGSVDAEGFVTLRGRTDDVINYAGVKIQPADIEAVLREHPGVTDVAVVGLSFPKMGEVPVAFVVPSGATPRKDVEDFCRSRIDGTRLPRAYVRVASIPRNAAGKVDRAALRRTPISSIRLGKR